MDLYHERVINDMDAAMENKNLIVYYQPKYDVTSDHPRLRSAEALIRWKHPELGMISPGDFIPLFESNGLIQKLDHYVWSEAASQIRKWKEEYGKTVPVSVNVSWVDIYDAGLEKRRTQMDYSEIMTVIKSQKEKLDQLI
ncbi:MAG: EAL domain-containing protein [Acetatifactor sp.]|nr:EAL domain-containing protein [Acetatifactor sp.]